MNPENSLVILPDVVVAWTTPTLPVTYWLDPNINYWRDQNGSIVTKEDGEPIVP